MKKLLISAVIAAAPFSYALAGGDKAADTKADAAAASKTGGAATATFPDWDTRKAGESLDVGGKKAAGGEK